MENNNLFSKEELRAKVFALQTMNQTISQSIGGNLNIRMNITDSNGDINDRYNNSRL